MWCRCTALAPASGKCDISSASQAARPTARLLRFTPRFGQPHLAKWTRRAVVEMVGGGGAGGGARPRQRVNARLDKAAGRGAFIRHLHSFTSDQSASTVAYAVGAGGTTGAAGSPGNAGSNTTWALGTLTAGGGAEGGSNGPGHVRARQRRLRGHADQQERPKSGWGQRRPVPRFANRVRYQLSGWGGNGPWGGGGALSVGANAAGNAGTANTGGGGSGRTTAQVSRQGLARLADRD